MGGGERGKGTRRYATREQQTHRLPHCREQIPGSPFARHRPVEFRVAGLVATSGPQDPRSDGNAESSDHRSPTGGQQDDREGQSNGLEFHQHECREPQAQREPSAPPASLESHCGAQQRNRGEGGERDVGHDLRGQADELRGESQETQSSERRSPGSLQEACPDDGHQRQEDAQTSQRQELHAVESSRHVSVAGARQGEQERISGRVNRGRRFSGKVREDEAMGEGDRPCRRGIDPVVVEQTRPAGGHQGGGDRHRDDRHQEHPRPRHEVR